MTLRVAEELEARRGRIRLKVKKPSNAVVVRTNQWWAQSDPYRVFYRGSRFRGYTKDGRELWQVPIAGRWVEMVEVPIFEDDFDRFERRRMEKK